MIRLVNLESVAKTVVVAMVQCFVSKIQPLKMYVFSLLTFGKDNLLFCEKGGYKTWEDKNYDFMVACC